jgi:hypothetical protein
MAVYTRDEWVKFGYSRSVSSFSPDGQVFYTGSDADEAWRRHHPTSVGSGRRPPLSDVVGKYLLVSQHSEPRVARWDESSREWLRHTYSWHDLNDDWWNHALPEIIDRPVPRWGHSVWLIGDDGSLTWVAADYDSSD